MGSRTFLSVKDAKTSQENDIFDLNNLITKTNNSFSLIWFAMIPQNQTCCFQKNVTSLHLRSGYIAVLS